MLNRDSYHHGELKQALIKEAMSQLNSFGVEQISFRSIARKIGVASSAPYNHFKNKKHLLTEISIFGKNKLINLMDDAKKNFMTPSDQLKAVGKAYLSFAVDEKPIFELMFSMNNNEYSQLYKEVSSYFERIVEEKFNEDIRKRISVFGASFTAWAMIHGLAEIIISGSFYRKDKNSNVELDKLFTEMSAIWGKGITK